MNIIIYSQPACTFCDQAKALLKSKKISFTEINLNVGQKQEEGKHYIPVKEFHDKFPKVRALPFILEGRTHIGGFTELQRFLRYD